MSTESNRRDFLKAIGAAAAFSVASFLPKEAEATTAPANYTEIIMDHETFAKDRKTTVLDVEMANRTPLNPETEPLIFTTFLFDGDEYSEEQKELMQKWGPKIATLSQRNVVNIIATAKRWIDKEKLEVQEVYSPSLDAVMDLNKLGKNDETLHFDEGFIMPYTSATVAGHVIDDFTYSFYRDKHPKEVVEKHVVGNILQPIIDKSNATFGKDPKLLLKPEK